MPTKYDIDVWRGNTLTRVFRLKQADGTPVDITEWEFVFRVVDRSTEVLRYQSPSAEITLTDAAGGEVTLAMTVADTRLLPEGSIARYELEWRYAGEQTTIFYGTLNVKGWANDDV